MSTRVVSKARCLIFKGASLVDGDVDKCRVGPDDVIMWIDADFFSRRDDPTTPVVSSSSSHPEPLVTAAGRKNYG